MDPYADSFIHFLHLRKEAKGFREIQPDDSTLASLSVFKKANSSGYL